MKSGDAAAVQELLRESALLARDLTVRSIYRRIEPGRDGRIRTVMNPAGTETGRFSHAETFLERSTNGANLPSKVAGYDALYQVKDCVVPEPGRVFVCGDLSQVEARIAAWMARDPLAMQQYRDGVDRYRFFAARLFGVEEADVSRAQRQCGKVVVLAMQYGVAWDTLMQHVNEDTELTGASINAEQSKNAVALFHRLYPYYRIWWDSVGREVAEMRCLTNPYGRKRWFFGRDDSQAAREKLERDAVAFLPQSTAVELLNRKLRILYDRYDPHILRVLLQIHDEVMVDCAAKKAEAVARLVKATLEDEVLVIGGEELRVPAEVSICRSSWGSKEKVAA